METAKEFFDKFLNMRKAHRELVFDKSSSRVYTPNSNISHQMFLRLCDLDYSNYFDIEINIYALKEDNSGEEIERIVIHIMKDDKDKGNIYLRMYRWIRFYFIDVDKIKETIYGICRKYGVDSNFLDFTCNLIKIIDNYCLDMYPYTITERNDNMEHLNLDKAFNIIFDKKIPMAKITYEVSFYENSICNLVSADVYITDPKKFSIHFAHHIKEKDEIRVVNYNVKDSLFTPPDIRVNNKTGDISIFTNSKNGDEGFERISVEELSVILNKHALNKEVSDLFSEITLLIGDMQEFAKTRIKPSGPDIIECIGKYGYKVYNIKATDDSQASIIIKRHEPDDECEDGYDILVNTIEKEGDILISKTNTEKFLIDTDGLISNLYIFDKEGGLYKHIRGSDLFDTYCIEGHFPKLLDAELRYAIYDIYFEL